MKYWPGQTVGLMVLLAAQSVPVFAQKTVAATSEPRESSTTESVLSRLVSVQITSKSLSEAIDALGTSAGTRIIYRSGIFDRYTTPVTLSVTKVALGTALTQLLSGTTLRAVPAIMGRVVITEAGEDQQAVGIITGHITDAVSKQAIAGATVALDGATRGIATGSDGSFRLTNVSAGAHKVVVRKVGYAKKTVSATVEDGATASVEVAITQSLNTLDQVIVTGTVIPTELKAVPNAITVITAKDLEQRGITHIDQLFRGDVPGVFAQLQTSGSRVDQVWMYSRGATALSQSSAGVGSFQNTNAIKTYVDGVEMAAPSYLAQIDPKSIERIEILTGPQASTIYGSGAINGVMQIFTKRGTTATPQVTVSLVNGWIQNNFNSAVAPEHEYNAQASGIDGHISYNAGGSWNYTGRWTPAKQESALGGFGGAKIDLPTAIGRVTSDVSLRRTTTQNLRLGDAGQPAIADGGTGYYVSSGTLGLNSSRTTSVLTGQTLGVTLGYAPTSWWSHEAGLGLDNSDFDSRGAPGHLWSTDSLNYLYQIHDGRNSMHYSTTAHVPVTSLAQATVTLGVDGWKNASGLTYGNATAFNGNFVNVGETHQAGHNTGTFLQTQLGLIDHLFLTYGLRAEWNPDFGKEAEPNYAPRYGIAYTQDIGPITAKLRGSYGRSTRPPLPSSKRAMTLEAAYGYVPVFYGPVELDYGNYNWILPNESLSPEFQQGGEGGLELYLGTRASLVVTRYNQTIDALITQVPFDSVRSFTPHPASGADQYDAAGYGYHFEQKNLNIGSIRNQGWELQGSVSVGPITTHGTYSWTKSRVIGVTEAFRFRFPPGSFLYRYYAPGSTFDFLPEHTWAWVTSYTNAKTTLSLSINGVGSLRSGATPLLLEHLDPGSIRLNQNVYNMSALYTLQAYIPTNHGYALADLNASQRINRMVEGTLQLQNVGNSYKNDTDASFASMGRQTKLGLRVRF